MAEISDACVMVLTDTALEITAWAAASHWFEFPPSFLIWAFAFTGSKSTNQLLNIDCAISSRVMFYLIVDSILSSKIE
ncbi:MAG: hypothetical protein H6680_07360 [Desulfobacteraceae bacterium]|nr:hypothetical protein [Desulfobacteraceae bacterium]